MSRNEKQRGGLSLKTLAIASAASALASYLVPMIWRPGTIAAAAAMPVIVALISEALSRPADRVRDAGRLVREVPRPALRRRERDEAGRRRLRLAVITGLLAFVLVAVVLTTTELFAGGAVSSDQRTTLLGGTDTDVAKEKAPEPATTPAPDEEAVPTVPETEPTPTPIPTPEPTPEPAPGTGEQPAPTPTPAAPTPPAPPDPTPVPPVAP